MTDWIPQLIEGIIKNAERLGALSATAIWAFFTLILIGFITWKMKAESQASEAAWTARIEEAKADGMIANALEKLSDQVKELRFKIRCLGEDDVKKN